MIVFITFAIAEVLHQLGGGVEDVGGRHQRTVFGGRAFGRPLRHIDRIRFRRGCQIDHALGERDFAFGRTQKIIDILGGKRLNHGLRIGQPNIFDAGAHKAAGDVERLLAARQHAREPIESGIGIGTANGFVQRGDDVEMFLARLVVKRCAALHGGDEGGGIQRLHCFQRGKFFGEVQHITAIAIGHGAQGCPRIFGERKFLAIMSFGALEQRFESRIIEPAQHQHLRAGKKRAVQLERRVLGCRADKHHRSIFHHGKEAILLAAIEAVNFIDEQQCALPHPAALAGGFEGFLEIGNTGEDGGQLFELKFECGGKQARDCCFSGAGRAPQNNGMRTALRDHAADGAIGRQKVILTDHFTERFRAQTIGQRTRRILWQSACFKEIAHGSTLPPLCGEARRGFIPARSIASGGHRG